MIPSPATSTRRAEPPYSDEEWSARIRQGDYEAFEDLFRTYYSALIRFSKLYAGSEVAAEEIVQDTLLTIWEHHAKWRPCGSVKAYLYGAVRRQAGQHHRRRQVRNRWMDRGGLEGRLPVEGCEDPEADLHLKDLQAAIEDALQELPERRRLIFLLSRNQGLTYAEIAALLDISVKTVDTQIGRAIRFLRKRVGYLLAITTAH